MLVFAALPGHAAAAGATQAPARGGSDYNITADTLTYDGKTKTFVAEGHVVVTSVVSIIRADRVVFHDDDDVLEAFGNVSIHDKKSVVFAKTATVRGNGNKGSLMNATIYLKVAPNFETLSKIVDPVCAKRAGKNRLVIEGEELDRATPRRYQLKNTMLTACDCGDDPPSWKIKSTKGFVDFDEQAVLLAPIIYAGNIPVFALPALIMPVGDRRSGFLFPRISYWGRDGLHLKALYYQTLGRSADLTAEGEFIQDRGLKWGLEGRYMLSNNSTGRFYGSFIKDTMNRGLQEYRWTFQHEHLQTLGDRFYLNDHIYMVGDSNYPNDFNLDIWERQADYLKSDLSLTKSFDDIFMGGGVIFYQDLKNGIPSKSMFERENLDTVQPLPWASFSLSTLKIPRVPLAFSLDTLYTNYYDPEKYIEEPPDDGSIDPGDIIRRTNRLTLNPKFTIPLNFADIVKWNSTVSARYSVYSGDTALGFPRQTGYVVAGSSLETQLGRVYEVNGKVFKLIRHAIVPQIEYRQVAATWAYGGVPVLMDEIDGVQTTSQVMFSLHNILDYKLQTGKYGRFFDIALSQGMDLAPLPNRTILSPLGLSFTGRTDYVATRNYLGYDWVDGKISEITANIFFTYPAGHSLYIQYNYLTAGERTHFSQGLEELFSTRFDQRLRAAGMINNINGGIGLTFLPGFRAMYNTTYSLTQYQFVQNVVGLSYSSQCNCWSTAITLTFQPGQSIPDISFFFDLANLGNIKG
jgi:LPS-assembly protein